MGVVEAIAGALRAEEVSSPARAGLDFSKAGVDSKNGPGNYSRVKIFTQKFI